MQYHYVVIYDSEHDRWLIEPDPIAYFPDGNIYSQEEWDNSGYGWVIPDQGSDAERIDYECFRILESCVPGILPTPSKED